MSAPAYVSVQEAARHLNLSRAILYQAIANGDLPVTRVGQRILRVPVSALQQFEERYKNATKQQRTRF